MKMNGGSHEKNIYDLLCDRFIFAFEKKRDKKNDAVVQNLYFCLGVHMTKV